MNNWLIGIEDIWTDYNEVREGEMYIERTINKTIYNNM